MHLTKSDFIAYLDSPKHLWAIKNGHLDSKKLNEYLQHLFQQGYEIENLAVQLIKQHHIPKYSLSPDQYHFQAKTTDQNFEARTDALLFNPSTNKWDMYEIKSGTNLKKQNYYDATFQTLVFEKTFDLGNTYILHPDGEYVREGELELTKLFQLTDVTQEVEELKEEVLLLRQDALKIAQLDLAKKHLDSCIRPKACPCLNLCHPNLPDYSIYDINNLTGNEAKIRELESLGTISIYDVPDYFKLSDKQRQQVEVAKKGQIYINKPAIEEKLNSLTYPLYFIDYETFNSAVPLYDGYKPYDHIPFQWSLHVIKDKDSEPEHHEFIYMEASDPVPHFISSLQQVIGDKGSIIVWNRSFEGKQNERIGEMHSQFKQLCENMNGRIFDLMEIFRDGLYADPKCKGSYSIKNVLPTMAPELTYEGMEIAEGATAMVRWSEVVFGGEGGGEKSRGFGEGVSKSGGTVSEDQKENVRKDLLKYCGMDTMAMVKIWVILNKNMN